MAVHLVAGPISYRLSYGFDFGSRSVSHANWEFIGFEDDGSVRRWNLRCAVKDRSFSCNALSINEWDEEHAAQLRDLYRPICVLWSDLPGHTITKLKRMISDEDIAKVMAISINGGKKL